MLWAVSAATGRNAHTHADLKGRRPVRFGLYLTPSRVVLPVPVSHSGARVIGVGAPAVCEGRARCRCRFVFDFDFDFDLFY